MAANRASPASKIVCSRRFGAIAQPKLRADPTTAIFKTGVNAGTLMRSAADPTSAIGRKTQLFSWGAGRKRQVETSPRSQIAVAVAGDFWDAIIDFIRFFF
jgi:hypothetical protein